MKRFLLLLTVMIGHLVTHAEEYAYLTFETVDGAKVSVSAPSLTMSISGTTLTVGEESFIFSNLTKMYFTDSDMTTTTGIKPITDREWKEALGVYDLSGRKVNKGQLPKGVYVIKSKNGTCKLVVKK